MFQHIAFGYLATNVLATIVNFLFWFKTPEQWVAFVEKYPYGSHVIKACRGYGLDPVRTLDSARVLLQHFFPSNRGGSP